MVLIRIFCLIVLLNLTGIQKADAEETDQFTLPPGELLDIGPNVSLQLAEVLERLMARTNTEIQMLLPRAKHSRYAASQLALRLKDTYLRDLFYGRTGPGFPRWWNWSRLETESKPTKHREIWPWKTVYWLVFSHSPPAIIGLSPTVNLYGHYFGTDKLTHFFMEGHTYYKIYSFYLSQGKSPEQAHRALVLYGQFLEHGFLGTLANGIYSNADLSANYAGGKFYLNLTQSVKMGKRTQPPILVLNGNKWEFANYINKDTLLKPFISDNLNEALNPCHYSYTRGQIRKQVEKRCTSWIENKGLTKQIVEAKLEETSLWHGEAYGHWLPADNAVTLNTCFGGK